ncbi:MAG: accessory gene regulator B family protein [Clostridiales Family XIII bacterium]|nr:accessory gene regulator B family protein [Clostridiales Family XIII bacterium]
MVEKLATGLTGYYVRKKIIPAQSADVYTYGFQLLISTFLNVFLVMMIASVLGFWPGALLFMFSFVLTRGIWGGYHAKTHWGCITAFVAVFAVFSVLANSLGNFVLPLYIVLGSIAYSAAMWKFAPVEAPNRPMSVKKKECFRRYGLLMASFFSAVALVVCLVPSVPIGPNAAFFFSGGFAAAFSMVFAACR